MNHTSDQVTPLVLREFRAPLREDPYGVVFEGIYTNEPKPSGYDKHLLRYLTRKPQNRQLMVDLLSLTHNQPIAIGNHWFLWGSVMDVVTAINEAAWSSGEPMLWEVLPHEVPSRAETTGVLHLKKGSFHAILACCMPGTARAHAEASAL